MKALLLFLASALATAAALALGAGPPPPPPPPRGAYLARSAAETRDSFASVLCHNTSLLQGQPTTAASDFQRLVVIGDVHGDLTRLQEVLTKARIIASPQSGCSFNATERTLVVQMGDVVDRGPSTWESWMCLTELQASAAAANSTGSRVVRLLGNHEALWLQGETEFRNQQHDTPEIVEKLTRQLKQAIMQGDVQATLSLTLFKRVELFLSHAGLRPQMYHQLVARVRTAGGHSSNNNRSSVSGSSISEFVNKKVRADVERCVTSAQARCRFKDAIYSAGKDRGGKEIGGILWTDWSVLQQAAEAAGGEPVLPGVIQIVGHTPSISKVKTTYGLGGICVDVGLYLGGAGFLEQLPSGHFVAHERDKKTGNWSLRDLMSPVCAEFMQRT